MRKGSTAAAAAVAFSQRGPVKPSSQTHAALLTQLPW
jgi:hypothetical protein